MNTVRSLLMVLALLVCMGLPATLLAGNQGDTGQSEQVVSKVNINQASAEQLQVIPGVGATLAERIVAYRTEHGAFATPEDLTAVRGIGEKSLAKLLPWIRVE